MYKRKLIAFMSFVNYTSFIFIFLVSTFNLFHLFLLIFYGTRINFFQSCNCLVLVCVCFICLLLLWHKWSNNVFFCRIMYFYFLLCSLIQIHIWTTFISLWKFHIGREVAMKWEFSFYITIIHIMKKLNQSLS